MGAVAELIETRLRATFAPERLEVVDDSGRHAGHAGASAGGESHFNVVIVSAQFQGVGRVQRQRMVYAALSEAFEGGLHALSVRAMAPGEA